MTDWKSVLLGFVSVLVAVAVMTTCVVLVTGCAPKQAATRIEQAGLATAYAIELDACVEHSSTFAAYETCAQEADRKFGVKP